MSVHFLIGSRQYVVAGIKVSRLHCFTTGDDINKFRSCLGNSSVPYGFGVGKHYTYFLASHTDYEKMENKGMLKHGVERFESFIVEAKSDRLGFRISKQCATRVS